MIPGSVLHHISSGVRGPWLRPWTKIFGFPNFPFGLVVNPITVHNFSFLSHLEVPGNFPMLNLWGNLQGPLVPPLDRNFGFSQFFLWFRGKTNHHAKFKLPRPSGSAQTFCSTHTHTFSFIYIDSRFEGEASPPQGPMRDMSRAQYFRSASHFGRLRAQYCRSASHFGSF